MSATSTATSSVDTYIDALGIDLQDLYEMTDAEREAFYENALRGLSDDEVADLESEIQDIRSTLKEDCGTVKNELQTIIDSTSSSLEDIASAEYWYDIMDGMYDIADSLSTDFGSAQTKVESENIDVTNGSSYSFTASDPQNGEEYVIDATSTESTADEPLFPDDYENQDDPSYVDSDGDGYRETQADTDGDGRADVNTNGDADANGVPIIDEKDMLDYNEQNITTQVITLNIDGTIELASYDAATGTTRWAVTEDDGTVYYVTIKGTPDIVLSGSYNLDTTGIADTWDPGLLNRMFESSTTQASGTSFGDVLEVEDPNATTTEDYYTIVDMKDQYDSTTGEYSYSVEPTDEDFVNGRDYTITCGEGYTQSDIINLEFGDDVTLAFRQDPSTGDLIITATNAENQSMTITIKNYGMWLHNDGTDSEMDTINITGGIIDEEDYADLNDIWYPVYEYEDDAWTTNYYRGFANYYLFGSISQNGTQLFDNSDIYDWYAESSADYAKSTTNPFTS